MPPEQLKLQARRIADELLTQGDLRIVDTVLAHREAGRDDPNAVRLKRTVRELRRAFPDLSAVADDEVVEGDRMAQRLRLRGTHRGDFLGVAPTGRRVEWVALAMFAADPDGRVVHYWFCTDLPGLLRQLGASTREIALR